MPTANRRAFVPLAIRYFQRQDYAEKELVILDDGEDAIGDLIPDDPRVRYIRLNGKRTLGAKRNECVEASQTSEDVQTLEKRLLLLGAPNVVTAYFALRRMEIEIGLQKFELQPQVVKLLLAMRHDLGQRTQGIKETDWRDWLFPATVYAPERISPPERKLRMPA